MKHLKKAQEKALLRAAGYLSCAPDGRGESAYTIGLSDATMDALRAKGLAEIANPEARRDSRRWRLTENGERRATGLRGDS